MLMTPLGWHTLSCGSLRPHVLLFKCQKSVASPHDILKFSWYIDCSHLSTASSKISFFEFVLNFFKYKPKKCCRCRWDKSQRLSCKAEVKAFVPSFPPPSGMSGALVLWHSLLQFCSTRKLEWTVQCKKHSNIFPTSHNHFRHQIWMDWSFLSGTFLWTLWAGRHVLGPMGSFFRWKNGGPEYSNA